mmetsp:Transcript_10790/g.30324  ORF Transcript_10790/g.30324 Transcript_10790/m.30324 type:complete len:291 (+) Transcript_10790:119-991(+)
MSTPRRSARKFSTICLLTTAATCTQSVSAFGAIGSTVPQKHACSVMLKMAGDEDEDGKLAGSFFNQVPKESPSSGADASASAAEPPAAAADPAPAQPETKGKSDDPFDFDQSVAKLMARRNKKPLAATPSTIGGVPTAKASGFGKQSTKGKGGESSPGKPVRKTSVDGKKSFVQLGKPLNDVNNPEYDDQGYTLYADEETGEKKRVFEALVEYPCRFTMKIVGANEGAFAAEMVQVVAESCEVEVEDVENSVKVNGKWTSVTVQAPVKSAEMLYSLYEAIDRDPRVKFKF